MHPEVLRLLSLWDLIWETTPSDREAQGRPQLLADLEMSRHLQTLGKVFHHITWETLGRISIPLGNWVHPYQPGDEIWVKDWKKEPPLQPVWTSPHRVVLATPTAVNVTPWIHQSRVKRTAPLEGQETWTAEAHLNQTLLVFFHRHLNPAQDLQPCSGHSRAGWSTHGRSLRNSTRDIWESGLWWHPAK